MSRPATYSLSPVRLLLACQSLEAVWCLCLFQGVVTLVQEDCWRVPFETASSLLHTIDIHHSRRCSPCLLDWANIIFVAVRLSSLRSMRTFGFHSSTTQRQRHLSSLAGACDRCTAFKSAIESTRQQPQVISRQLFAPSKCLSLTSSAFCHDENEWSHTNFRPCVIPI